MLLSYDINLSRDVINEINTDIKNSVLTNRISWSNNDLCELKSLQYDFLEMAERIEQRKFEQMNVKYKITLPDENKTFKSKARSIVNESRQDEPVGWVALPIGIVLKDKKCPEKSIYCATPTKEIFLRVLSITEQHGFNDLMPLYKGDPIPPNCTLRLTAEDFLSGTTRESLRKRVIQHELQSVGCREYRLHVETNNVFSIETPDGERNYDLPSAVAIKRQDKPDLIIKTATWEILHKVLSSSSIGGKIVVIVY